MIEEGNLFVLQMPIFLCRIVEKPQITQFDYLIKHGLSKGSAEMIILDMQIKWYCTALNIFMFALNFFMLAIIAVLKASNFHFSSFQ